MSHSISSDTSNQSTKTELERLQEDWSTDSENSFNDTLLESQQTGNGNVGRMNDTDHTLMLENSFWSLPFRLQSDLHNIKSDEENSTDSEDYNYKRNTTTDITVDETDYAESADEGEANSSNVPDIEDTLGKTYVGSNSAEQTLIYETPNKLQVVEASASESTLSSLNDWKYDDVDIIESSDNMETFINISKNLTVIPPDVGKKIETSELDDADADLFASQEEQWLIEKAASKQIDNKLFTHKDWLSNLLTETYKIKESDLIKILNYDTHFQNDGFHGFDKNEFNCKIKHCPTKREKDLQEYFMKCQKDIESLAESFFSMQQEQQDNNEKDVLPIEKKDPLREIIKNIENNGVRKFINNDIDNFEEDCLGFGPNDFKCNYPKCAPKKKNVRRMSKRIRNNENFLERSAQEFIFKKPNPKKPKVIVESVFSLFE